MTPAQPPIVAELGRPETPEEAAERKAEASRVRRSNQTALNLVIATIASLGIVAFLIAVVVRPDATARPPADYIGIAQEADEAVPLLAPPIPADWYANDARITSEAGVRTWAVGFVTGDSGFIGLDQGIGLGADPALAASRATWLGEVLDGLRSTGTMTIGGAEWAVYDNRDDPEPGNYAYAIVTDLDGSTVVLHGTADDASFEALAASIAGGAS